jgi:hypothetical protein
MHHVFNGSRSRLPDKNDSSAAMCTVALDPLGKLRCAACPVTSDPASLQGGFWAATHPAVPCGPWSSTIKKRLAGMRVQLDTHGPNTRAHVFNVPHVRVIM